VLAGAKEKRRLAGMWQAEQRREMHAGCGGLERIEGCRPLGKSRCR